MKEEYVRKATCVRAIDGDSLELFIDLGFDQWHKRKVRVLGLYCPETKGPEKEAGLAAKAAAEDWLKANPELIVQTHLETSFERVLAEVRAARTGERLADHLIAMGHGSATPKPKG